MMNFMMKPTSFHCNLACKYCFYLEKEKFMKKQHEQALPFMQPEQVEDFMEKRLKSSTEHDVYLTWQGGEPLLAGLKFYEKVVQIAERLEKKYQKKIHYAVQTNATLITDEWSRFFRQHRFLIGVSIDGDQKLHDTYRQTIHGSGTFNHVTRGIESLQKAGVEFNTLTVVNNINVKEPLRIYYFLKSLDVKFMQFIPVVETVDLDHEHKPTWLEQENASVEITEFSVSPQDYGEFIAAIFHDWIRYDVTTVSVRLFDSLIAQFLGHEATLCIFREKCGGDNLALEANGEIYQCDHFVYPNKKFQIGNVNDSWNQLNEKIGEWSSYKQKISSNCQQCSWLKLCHGGCPKHRFVSHGQPERKNYFCDAYQYIFSQLTPGLNLLAEFFEKNIPLEYLPDAVERVYKK